ADRAPRCGPQSGRGARRLHLPLGQPPVRSQGCRVPAGSRAAGAGTRAMTSLPAPSMDMTVGRQGHYAGGASRLLAFAADIGALWGLFSAGVALISLASELAFNRSVTISHHQILAVVVLVVWSLFYFSYPW